MADQKETKTKDTEHAQASAPSAGKKEKDAKGVHVKQAKKKNLRKRRRRRKRPRSEFEHRVIDVRRVTRVIAGGRRFSFSVVVVAGDKKGRVGVGIGKANDTATAIDKALRDAKGSMKTLRLTSDNSIPHEVEAKYASALVRIFPSPGKGGITAGGAVRNVLELGGVENVGAKIISRSKNKLNNARATMLALSKLRTPSKKKAAVKS